MSGKANGILKFTHRRRIELLNMKIIMLKKPKKPAQYIVVDKKSEYRWAEDLVSTTNVLRPSWKCVIIENTSMSDVFHASIVQQAVVEPLRPVKTEESDILKALEALM